MTRFRPAGSWLCCLLLTQSLAFSWWETGHQVVARIAADHLTPAARTRLARILNVEDNPSAVADALASASTWADETKAQTKTGSWHFIDLAIQDEKSDIPARCKDDNCAPARIRLFAAQLASRTPDARWSDLDAVRYVVHLVGDIHQPLHTISDADLGGNCELLDQPIGEAKNLHGLWDGVLVSRLGGSATELTADLENQIDSMSESRRKQIASGNQDDWVWESHELASFEVYHALHIPLEPVEFPANCQAAPESITGLHLEISSGYLDDMKGVARMQLLKAGLRLARLLNESL